MANRFCGCSVWALAPFSAVFGFCCLLCFSAGETQVWLGDLRVVVFCWFLWLCGVLIDLSAPMDINVFSAHAHVRTEPLARHRPLEEKSSMQQVCFVNNHWSSCPQTLAPKTFAPSCKVQKMCLRPQRGAFSGVLHAQMVASENCCFTTVRSVQCRFCWQAQYWGSVSRQNHRGWACSAASCGTTRQVSVHKPWQAQYFKRKHGHPQLKRCRGWSCEVATFVCQILATS